VTFMFELCVCVEPPRPWDLHPSQAAAIGQVASSLDEAADTMAGVISYGVFLALSEMGCGEVSESTKAEIRHGLGMKEGADIFLGTIDRSLDAANRDWEGIYLHDLMRVVAKKLRSISDRGSEVQAKKIEAKGAQAHPVVFARRLSAVMQKHFKQWRDEDVAVIVRATFGEGENWNAQRVRQLRSATKKRATDDK